MARATTSTRNPIDLLAPALALLAAACFTDFLRAPDALDVESLTFRVIEPGGSFTCGLTRQGEPYCWGALAHSLGDASTEADLKVVPVPVPGGLRFDSLTVGDLHACGLTSSGEAYCWGWNTHLQLGSAGGTDQCDGRFVEGIMANGLVGPCSLVPVRVPGLSLSAISAGSLYTCGVATSGDTFCWGSAGQLGNVSDSALLQTCTVEFDFGGGSQDFPCAPPLRVEGGQTFVAVSAATEHTCALTATGSAYCWGTSGLLGNDSLFQGLLPCGFPDPPCGALPVQVSGGVLFASLSLGMRHSCGLTLSGEAQCWGPLFGSAGYALLGTMTDSIISQQFASSPFPVDGGLRFRSLAATGDFTCGASDAGSLYCWGYVLAPNESGGGGFAQQEFLIPTAIGAPTDFATISASSAPVICAVTTGGEGYCWGSNEFGQLGNGSLSGSGAPVPVLGPPRQ